MNPNDVAVIESLLRSIREATDIILRDSELALELLAATKCHSVRATPRHPDLQGVIDEARFVVCWRGTECSLGQTIAFRLFQRLASSLNRYVSHERLLDDVWGGPRSASAVRSAIGELRRKLTESGLAELASAIDGSNPGHYGLRLDLIHERENRTENGR